MRIIRFLRDGTISWGIVEGDDVHTLVGSLWGQVEPGRRLCALGDVKLLAPVEQTNKIVGIGRNYIPKTERANQDGPGVFLKSPTSVIAQGENIVYPRIGEEVIFEGELVLIMGKKARHVSVDEALDCVFGYTISNDVTARKCTTRDDPLFGINHKGKYFDTFFPLGPWVVPGLDGNNLHLQTRVNGVVKQDASTSQMTWNIQETISFVSDVMTLLPGDVISTGCPPGIEAFHPGDIVEVEIEEIGLLSNPVVAEE